MNNLYAFVHVPKTGGTLIKMSIKKYLCIDKTLNEEHTPIDLYKKHDHDHLYMTMIRDPYDRACSEYFYIKRQVNGNSNWNQELKNELKYINNVSINEFLENFKNTTKNGIYSYYYNSTSIEDFNFVGLVESFDKSLLLMKNMFNFNIEKNFIHFNAGNHFMKPYSFKYSKEIFKKNNQNDYEIYNKGKQYFHNLCLKYSIML